VSFLRISLVALALASTSLLGCGYTETIETNETDETGTSSQAIFPSPIALPQPIQATYYVARKDTRRCAYPNCGGYFVSAVNQTLTRCARGAYAEECYVSKLDFSQFDGPADAETSVPGALGVKYDTTRVVLLGTMHPALLGLGTMRVDMAWIALKPQAITGDFYGARNNQIVCVAAPCPSYDQEFLNRGNVVSFHGFDFSDVPPHAEDSAFTSPALNSLYGMIVTGVNTINEDAGPAGPATILKASQVFIPLSVLEERQPVLAPGPVQPRPIVPIRNDL
jgi:hypothetical protein